MTAVRIGNGLRGAAAAFAAAALLSSTGCVLKQDYDKMVSKVDALENRVGELERRADIVGRLQADATADLERIRDENREIKGQLSSDTVGVVALRQEGALLESRLLDEQLREEANSMNLSELRGEIDRLSRQLQHLQSGRPAAAAAMSRTKSMGSEDKARALYSEGLELYKAKRFRLARSKFDEFLKRYKRNSYADNAQYWVGETYYAERDYQQAALAFNRVIENYPQGDKVALAMLRLGFSFFELEMYEQARPSLLKVIERYPDSKQASVAKRKLLLIRQIQQERASAGTGS